MGIPSASFVVRLRSDAAGHGTWWGEVQRVDTGERVAFRDEAKLLEFLRRHLAQLDHRGTNSPGPQVKKRSATGGTRIRRCSP